LAFSGTTLQAKVRTSQTKTCVDIERSTLKVIFLSHNIDDPGSTFSIVFGRWGSDYFHGFDFVSGDLLQRVSNRRCCDSGRAVIDQYQDIGATSHGHVSVQIHREHRHSSEYVSTVTTGSGLVILSLIDGTVHA